MENVRFKYKTLIDSTFGPYVRFWDREGGFTLDIKDAILIPENENPWKPSDIHPNLVWGRVEINVSYYEDR